MSFKKFFTLGAALFAGTLSVGLVACSNPQQAGGVTDIGNSIAGIVVDSVGAIVPSARVVAYYDSWNQPGITDSVVATADSEGAFELQVKKDAAVVLFASAGESCGLTLVENKDKVTSNVSIGKRRAFSSHIAGRLTGEMRVVGTDSVASLDSTGYFIFNNMPPGDIALAYNDSTDSATIRSRVEFTTTGNQSVMELPALNFLEGDPAWLTVMDLRYYVDEGHDGLLVWNPVSDYWTPVTSLPVTDSLSAQVVTVNVPQTSESLMGFLFPIKVSTKAFADTVNQNNVVVVNKDTWELYPSEIEYWNEDEALLWVRISGVATGTTSLNFQVFESAEYASKLILFDVGQKYDGVLSKIHFDGDAKVLDSNLSVATAVADSSGFLGNGVTLNPGQFLSIDSVDVTYGNFTMSLWTKWGGDNGRAQVLASERGDSTYKIQWRYNDGKFSLLKGVPGSTEVFDFGSAESVPTGEWIHLVLTSSSGVYTMYVNGEPLGDTVQFTPSYVGTKMLPVRIGGSGNEADTWNGSLDEFRIESVVRSADWIKSAYEQQKSAAQ